MKRPKESIYITEGYPIPKLAILNDLDSSLYLKRLNLSSSTTTSTKTTTTTSNVSIDSLPTLELLSILLLQHQLKIPFDSSSIHVKDWFTPSHSILLGSCEGIGMPLDERNFSRIIENSIGGGYCYSLNGLFASFLRGFGFRVSEIGARVQLKRGENPSETGYDWSAITHLALLVDNVEGKGDNRYLVDVGFGGGGSPIPILLQSGIISPSISLTECFQLKAETIPGSTTETFQDTLPGFTLYRRVLPSGLKLSENSLENLREGKEAEEIGYWTPCYFFLVATLSISDIKMCNWFNSTSPESTWTNFLAVSTLLPSGARQTLASIKKGDKMMGKYWIKEGIKGVEEDVKWVEFETGPMGVILREKFGFGI